MQTAFFRCTLVYFKARNNICVATRNLSLSKFLWKTEALKLKKSTRSAFINVKCDKNQNFSKK